DYPYDFHKTIAMISAKLSLDYCWIIAMTFTGTITIPAHNFIFQSGGWLVGWVNSSFKSG
ncbi:11724_t:CDS:2, partial [Gigaspora rosea]